MDLAPEEKISQEAPWPGSGAGLFRSGADWWNNAILHPSRIDWRLYSEGYRRAADNLVDHVNETGRDQDYLVYPVVFLYRHFVELSLKNVIVLGTALTDRPMPRIHHHKLEVLWKDARAILHTVWPTEATEDLDAVCYRIAEISKVDPGSFAFRYPTDGEGNAVLPEGMYHVNLRILKDGMDEMAQFFDSCTLGLSVMLESKEDAERLKAELEKEFRSISGWW